MPSVVVSSADKSIMVFDNGALAASGKIEIQNPEKPLGERVYLEWRGRSVRTSDLAGRRRSERPQDDERGQRRGSRRSRPTCRRRAVRKRLKFGMTLVTTDQPADAETRSSDRFVVLDLQG